MIEKAKRASMNLLRFGKKSAEENAKEEAKKALKRAESWKAISDTEFAKNFIDVCDEITELTYQSLCNVVLGDLTPFEENPGKLLALVKGMQQRLIAIRTIMGIFIPHQESINALKEQSEKEE